MQQRDTLVGLVRRLATPKALAGGPMTGPSLAALIRGMVAALNAKVARGATLLHEVAGVASTSFAACYLLQNLKGAACWSDGPVYSGCK